ncbi:MAG: hypothetical protein BRC29_01330 [Nanohaloarchaea archaeon SW_7_43_1]|nr:MAG: hypothetical protein BRC29_01330 [Nanohaloarchaea archaeon SW_7_43_1]
MDKVLAIIISASVLLTAGIIVLAIALPSISNIEAFSDSSKSTACQNQVDKYKNGAIDLEEVDQECIDSSDVLMYKYLGQKHEDTLAGSSN